MINDETDWVSLQVPDGTDWIGMLVDVSRDADQGLRDIMNHIAIGVADIDPERQQLIKNGVKLTEEGKIGRDGKWQLHVYDPDQTRSEFMELTPVQKPRSSDFTAPHPQPWRRFARQFASSQLPQTGLVHHGDEAVAGAV